MQLTLIDKKQETPDTISFIFKPDEEISWKAGQYLRYTLPQDTPDDRGENRFFTISAAPHEGFLMLTTRFTPEKGSSFKSALKDLPIGSKLQTHIPSGEFVIKDPEKQYVFIAGGIGITPFRSILKDLDFRKQPINVTLLYANKRSLSGQPTASSDKSLDNIPFKEELEDIASRNPGLRINYVIDPQRIDADYIKQNIPDLNTPFFYVSGPEPMVEGIEKQLESLGVPKEHIKQDYFPGYSE